MARGGGMRGVRVEMNDGQTTSIHQSDVHWEIAEMLLDAVRPSRVVRPAPSHDAMVRDWYVATSAWMQFNVHYDLKHLDRARQLFPDDPDVLFFVGTHHAVYATSRIQHALKSLVLPRGYWMDAKSGSEELHEARTLLQRVVAIDPTFAEAHLRLGRILALDGELADAERELSAAEAAVADDRRDPYWVYDIWQARSADDRLAAVRQPFESEMAK